jgi:PAS domain S-box-containing protein
MIRPWQHLTKDEESPLVRTVFEGADGAHAWLPAGSGPETGDTGTATGIAAVPLPLAEPPSGALAVLTAAAREPSAEQWALLDDVAAWAAALMRRPPPLGPASPEEPQADGTTLQQALRAVRVGSWECTLATGELILDEQALTVLGIDAEDFDGRVETWRRMIHPDDLPLLSAEGERAIRTGSLILNEHRVNRPDGTSGWVQVRGRVKPGDIGEPVAFVGTICDTTESRSAREEISHALRHMSDGFLAVDSQWRITFVNKAADTMMGSGRDIVGCVLWDPPASERLRLLSGLQDVCRRVVDTGTPTDMDIQAPRSHRWYHLRLIPLPDGLAFFFTDIHDKREREAAERAEVARAVRTGQLTAALAEAIGTQGVVDAVARHVLPMFGAAGLVVQVIEGDRARAVGSAGYPQAFLDRIATVSLSGANALTDALHTRTPLFFSSPEEYIARYPDLAYQPALGGKKAWAFLPLIATDHPIGVCVVSFEQPRRLTSEERTLLVALSGLVAQALERARLFDAEHIRAKELQRGLLPQTLPSVPACSTAVRYLPAGQGMDVGGDWYDLIPLSSHRIALVIGDVMGHGLTEAAAMGRLRTAVHTLADLELPPDEILEHLNDVVSGLGDDSYATCLYAVYDPATGACVFARAGHPPPAVVHPDGTVHFPDLAPDPPLGAAEPPFETTELTLPEGSLLALYTDGLVESSSRDIDSGMAHLARLLGEGCGGDLDALCEKLTAGLLPAQQQSADDAALLVARIHRLPAEAVAAWPLPAEPQAAREARRLVCEQLSAWNLGDLTMTTELLVSELVGNVARHAKGPVALRMLRSRTLICEVSDGSLTTPRIRRASVLDEGGRGLQLVAALSRRWGTRYTATGKCIWTEQVLTGPEMPDAPRPRSDAG